MRKQITWEKYCEYLGNVPKGKRLVYMSNNTFFLDDSYDSPVNKPLPKGKNKAQSKQRATRPLKRTKKFGDSKDTFNLD